MSLKRAAVVAVGVFILAAILGIRSFVIRIQANLDRIETMAAEHVDVTRLADGVYIGTCDAYPVAAEVRVTMADGRITGIELLSHKCGQGQPAEAILDEILRAQTVQLNAISGATMSSRVILKAVEDALRSAPAGNGAAGTDP